MSSQSAPAESPRTSNASPTNHCRTGFTLVELLVVIGIIALLISILIPALSKAKAQANALKCEMQLREIGNAFRFYASENRNYYPPTKLTLGTDPYDLDKFQFNSTYPAYWFNFVNKYATKNSVGYGSTSAAEANDAKNRSVLWGCPNFEAIVPPAATGYGNSNNGAGVNVGFVTYVTGYGMNAYPGYTASFSGPFLQAETALPLGASAAHPDWVDNWTKANPGATFVKASVWGRHGAERMLVSESKYFVCFTGGPVGATTVRGVTTPGVTYVGVQNGALANATTDQQSYYAYWRHGKLPPALPSSGPVPDGSGVKYDVSKGRLSYNILYCDGHVTNATDAKDSYLASRMKYPG